MNVANITIDPGVVTLIQSNFLDQINAAFSVTAHYAANLLYLFAAMELAVLGLAWALQREIGWDKLFFKIIKIGMIFFVVQNYSWLMKTILYSFAQLAGVVVNNSAIAQYVFNPAKIWQYGYDIGIHILELGANTGLPGLSLLEVFLGMGILLVFGLLGIQMVIQVVSFYLVSFGSLILIPFGALTSGRNMFDKAVQAVLKAGLRLMVLIIIIGIAAVTWNGFQLTDMATTTNFNLNQPLGLFFTALLFLCLAIYLPKVVSEAIGDLNSNILEGGQTTVATIREPAAAFTSAAPSSNMANVQAAATIAPGSGSSIYEGTSSTAAAASIPTTVVSSSTGGGLGTKTTEKSMSQASTLAKSISESTVKKIKEAVIQAVKEKSPHN